VIGIPMELLMHVKSMNVSLEEKMNGETNNVDPMVMFTVQLLNVNNVQVIGLVMILWMKLMPS
jgi:hypothetical protein